MTKTTFALFLNNIERGQLESRTFSTDHKSSRIVINFRKIIALSTQKKKKKQLQLKRERNIIKTLCKRIFKKKKGSYNLG